jgi:hypothetical protein
MLKGEGGKTHMQTPFSGESIHLYYPPPPKKELIGPSAGRCLAPTSA